MLSGHLPSPAPLQVMNMVKPLELITPIRQAPYAQFPATAGSGADPFKPLHQASTFELLPAAQEGGNTDTIGGRGHGCGGGLVDCSTNTCLAASSCHQQPLFVGDGDNDSSDDSASSGSDDSSDDDSNGAESDSESSDVDMVVEPPPPDTVVEPSPPDTVVEPSPPPVSVAADVASVSSATAPEVRLSSWAPAPCGPGAADTGQDPQCKSLCHPAYLSCWSVLRQAGWVGLGCPWLPVDAFSV